MLNRKVRRNKAKHFVQYATDGCFSITQNEINIEVEIKVDKVWGIQLD